MSRRKGLAKALAITLSVSMLGTNLQAAGSVVYAEELKEQAVEESSVQEATTQEESQVAESVQDATDATTDGQVTETVEQQETENVQTTDSVPTTEQEVEESETAGSSVETPQETETAKDVVTEEITETESSESVITEVSTETEEATDVTEEATTEEETTEEATTEEETTEEATTEDIMLLADEEVPLAYGVTVSQGEDGYDSFSQNKVIASFDFGTDVSAETVYNAEAGYGFADVDFNTDPVGWSGNVYYPRVANVNDEAASFIKNADDAIAIDSKVWTETESSGYGVYTYENTSTFNVDVYNADYKVDVTFVNPTDTAYNAYVEAEDITRKTDISVAAGASQTVSVTACVVDGQLNLKFLGTSNSTSISAAETKTVYVDSVKVTRLATNEKSSKPTIFIASDSTVQTYDAYYYPQTGWGQTLAQFFGYELEEKECDNCNFSQSQTYETENVVVENRAIGGRSSKSYVEEGKLDDLLEDIKPGDYLLVQWGHNDATYSRPNRYVASSEFKKWMMYYVNGAIQRGATPILVTPVARYSYTTNADGTLKSFASNFEAYRQVMLAMAEEENIALVDLTQRSIDVCNTFGIEGAKSLFLHVAAGDYTTGAYTGGATDSTHLQYYGAYKFAQCVAQGITEYDKDNRLDGLKKFVVNKTADSVPGAISGLNITSTGATSISFTWEAQEGAELYYIYRAVLEDGQSVDDIDFANADKFSVTASTKYTDGTCGAGKTYVYAVRGFNDKGLGEFSEKVATTTKTAGYRFDFNYNNSPTMEGWIGVNQNQMYDAAAGYGWISAPNNGRYRGNNGNGDSSDMADDFNLGAGEFAVDIPNGDYEVTVYACDLLSGTSTIKPSYTAEGNSLGSIACKQSLGSCTNVVRVTDGQLNLVVGGANQYISGMTITELLLAPSGVVATEASVNGSNYSFLIGFNPVEEAAGYKIYRKGGSDKEFQEVKAFTVEEYKESELDCRALSVDLGEIYEYYMTCYTADGVESAPSITITVEALDPNVKTPSAPKNVVCTSPSENATELQEYVSIAWEASTVEDSKYDVIKYLIYRSDRAEGDKGFTKYEKIGESSTLSYTDETVKTNISYYYKVCAMNAGGVGELSEACKTPVAGKLVAGGIESYTDRALVAISLEGNKGAETLISATDAEGNALTKGVYLSWRSFEADFGADNELQTTFDVYCNGALIADNITVTNMVYEGGKATDSYCVIGSNDSSIGVSSKETRCWNNQYLEMNLYCPDDATMPDGSTCTYEANDMSVGDLDGDGNLELIVKWYPSNAKDNSGSGYTGKTFLDAYEVDFATGATKLLWRIDMGVNIRSGAHYTQFQVWDYDCDGKAEIAVKTADGTTSFISEDGTEAGLKEVAYVGKCATSALPVETISTENDYRNTSGYVLDGPEYFTIFNGDDATVVDTADYTPARGTVSAWGDAYGNRVDRFLSATAYLDGQTPFAVFCRGYYTRTCLTAYYLKDTDGDNVGDTIAEYWAFDTLDAGSQYEAQGNHGLSVNDVDRDGKDEIIYGALVVDDNGTVKYSTGLGHGDAMHVSDWVSWNNGLEIMSVHEHDNADYHVEVRDAETGEILMGYYTGKDTGRGVAADIDPTAEGAEFWSIASPTYESNDEPAWDSTNGEVYSTWSKLGDENLIKLASVTPASNASIFWDGDLLSEIQDHTFNKDAYAPTGVALYKWNYETEKQDTLLYSKEIFSINGTKGNLGLVADIVGDWREEIIARCADDQNKVRLYATTIQTDYVVPCLLENLAYREGVAWQNVGYNQPANLSYLLSEGLVTAQLSEGDVTSSAVELLFSKASDGKYGHDVEGYEIYRAGADGKYEKIDTLTLDELTSKNDANADSGNDATDDEAAKADPVYLKFDFGAVATKEGWTTVDATTAFSTELGYGFTDVSTNANKSYAGAIEGEYADVYNDAVLAWTTAATGFDVVVPNGTYEVTYYIYNGSGHVYNKVTAEGVEFTDVRRGSSSKEATCETKTVEVTDGVMNIVNTGSKTNYNGLYFTGIEIKDVTYDVWLAEKENTSTDDTTQNDTSSEPKLAEYRFDFGAGAVKEGWTAVDATTAFSEELGYGFTDVSTNANKSYGDAIEGDYADVYNDAVLAWTTAETGFDVVVPNGTYEVTYYIYNGSGHVYNKVVAEGVEFTDVRRGSSSKEATCETKTVEVTDGVMNIVNTGSKTNYNGLYFTGIEIIQTKAAEVETPVTPDEPTEDNTEDTGLYSYVDKNVESNTAYSYKVAAIVDGKTSHMSRALTIETAVAIAEVSALDKVTLVEGTPIADGATVASLLPATIEVTTQTGDKVQTVVNWDVTGLDLTKTGTYTVNGTIKGYEKTVELTVEVVANAVIGYEKLEAVSSVIGLELTLPATINVEYTNTTTDVKNITWDMSTVDINTIGDYTVVGTVEGTTDQIELTVHIVDTYITSVAAQYVEIAYKAEKVAELLPTTVVASYANNKTETVAVTWNAEEVAAIDTSVIGTATVNGTVEGFDGAVVVNVTVAYPLVKQFDFGISTSKEAEGWIGITVNAKGKTKTVAELGIGYSEEKGYGFLDETAQIQGRTESLTMDGILPVDVYTDFAIPDGQTFAIDVPNGEYQVQVLSNSGYKSTVKSTIEGTGLNVSNAAGTYNLGTVTVTVEDGQLTCQFTAGATSRMGAIIVRQIALAGEEEDSSDVESSEEETTEEESSEVESTEEETTEEESSEVESTEEETTEEESSEVESSKEETTEEESSKVESSEEKKESSSERKPSSSSSSNTSTQKPVEKVTIEELMVPLASGMLDGGFAFETARLDEKQTLRIELLQKYHGRNMYVMAHLGNGVGFTVNAADTTKATANVELKTTMEKVPNFAEGFNTIKVTPNKAAALEFEVGLHVNVGKEYVGMTAYIFTKSLVTGEYQLSKVMTVNEIGNVAVTTNEMTDVMVLIQK